jgi:mannitol-1-/sugar-/sorbitol-6-phosphatase
VIEDAPAGVAAGRAAGMTVWGVTTTHTAAELHAAGAARTAESVAAYGMLISDLSPTMNR